MASDWVFGLAAAGLFASLLFRSLWKRMIDNLGQRYILVTGCDSGFGFSLALRLDELGCQVFAGCLTQKGASELDEKTSERCRPILLDVTSSESVEKAKETIKQQLPENKGLWGVVNNAGVSTSGLIRWLRRKDYEFCMNVNFYGTVDVTTAFLPFVQKAGGRVVNMSSMTGLFPMVGSTPYSISKCAVEAFSDILRRENKDINVCIVEPGAFKTPITTPESIVNNMVKVWERAPPDVKEKDRQLVEKMADKIKTKMEKSASDQTHKVIDAYVDALLSRKPRKRYVIGADANLLRLLSVLPANLADFAFDFMRG